jgi:DNA-binding MarR family transcriptional regulator
MLLACILRVEERTAMTSTRKRTRTAADAGRPDDYSVSLERATRGLLELNVAVLESMEKKVGLAPLRALQSLERLGPSLVTALGDDLNMLTSTASRLSDRLADAGLITRRVSPTNRRATLLELTDLGRAVLDELVTLRQHELNAVAELMNDDDRAALLQGTHAFTAARQRLSQHGCQ